MACLDAHLYEIEYRIEAISIVLRTVKMPLIDEIGIIIRSLSNVKYDV
jgi:hypothetical protein